MNLLSALFSGPPKIGSQWMLNEEAGNPFVRYVHTVIQIKNDWVLYQVSRNDALLHLAESKVFWFKYFRKEIK